MIERGPEYGTTESAWKGVTGEAQKLCNLHQKIKEDLMQKVVPDIKQWQKDNFHRTMIQLKNKKEFEEAFKKVCPFRSCRNSFLIFFPNLKAQKPWAKLLSKVNKTKIDYHNACKNERSVTNQERNASGDTSLSPDQVYNCNYVRI